MVQAWQEWPGNKGYIFEMPSLPIHPEFCGARQHNSCTETCPIGRTPILIGMKVEQHMKLLSPTSQVVIYAATEAKMPY